jgi:hypothetical protein
MAFYNKLNDPTNFVNSVSRTPKYGFCSFAEGYRFAAHTVAKELIDNGHFPDYNAYPIVFLYRHALELHLKNIIYCVAKLSVFKGLEDIDNKLYNTHKLDNLSCKVNNILTKLFPEDEGLHQFLEEVVLVAKEYSEIDIDSFAYRYPIDTRGEHSTKSSQCVNLRSLDTHMNDLLKQLENIDFGINIETDIAQEIYEEFEDF